MTVRERARLTLRNFRKSAQDAAPAQAAIVSVGFFGPHEDFLHFLNFLHGGLGYAVDTADGAVLQPLARAESGLYWGALRKCVLSIAR